MFIQLLSVELSFLEWWWSPGFAGLKLSTVNIFNWVCLSGSVRGTSVSVAPNQRPHYWYNPFFIVSFSLYSILLSLSLIVFSFYFVVCSTRCSSLVFSFLGFFSASLLHHFVLCSGQKIGYWFISEKEKNKISNPFFKKAKRKKGKDWVWWWIQKSRPRSLADLWPSQSALKVWSTGLFLYSSPIFEWSVFDLRN